MSAQDPKIWSDWMERVFISVRSLDEARRRTDIQPGELDAYARLGKEALSKLAEMAAINHDREQ